MSVRPRVVFDTNVLVSALMFSQSKPRSAWNHARSTGRADFLLTGDADLLMLNPFQGTAILSPAAYLGRS